MIKNIMILLLFIVSCKETETYKDNRNALVAHVDQKDNLLIYSYDNDEAEECAIKVEDLKTGKEIFFSKIEQSCFTEPRIQDRKLYFPDSNHSFNCIDYKNNKVLWKLKTKGRIREFQLVNDDIIIASVDTDGLVAIHSKTGKIIYELPLHSEHCTVDSAPRPIGFDENCFYVADFNCTLIAAYEISSGKKVWSREMPQTGFSNFIVAGKYIFLGRENSDKDGEIMLMEAETGTVIYSHASAAIDIMVTPVLYRDKIYYYTLNSELNEFDLKKETTKVIYKGSVAGNQMYHLGNFLYIQDVDFNVNRINLDTLEKKMVTKSPKGLLGVYALNHQVQLIY